VTPHRHRCMRCGYVWQCTEWNRTQSGHDICAICETLDRMRRWSGPIAKQGQEQSWHRYPHFVDRSGATVGGGPHTSLA
jgi:hypothetical protein